MKGAFDSVFGSISGLNSDSVSYRSNVDKLKQQISLADIDVQTKSQLFGILELPQGMQAIGTYNLDATQIKESFGSRLAASSLRMDSILNEMENRLLKNEVYGLLYSENGRLQKGSSQFEILSEAQATILSKENRPIWVNQSGVRDLEKDYARATKLYDERNFADAKDSAEKAIDDVIAIEKKGRVLTENPPLFSQDLLFQVAAVLAALLVALYLFNNRGKIRGFISPSAGEVDAGE